MRDLFFVMPGVIRQPVFCCHPGEPDSGSTHCRNDAIQVMLLIPGMTGWFILQNNHDFRMLY
jgi:hypothetical protein